MLLAYLLLGIAIGTISGLLGLGGGIFLVPIFTYVFTKQFGISSDLVLRFATGTSLAIMIVSAGVTSVTHHRNQNINWHVARYIMAGMVTGAVLGVWFTSRVEDEVIKLLFSLLCLFSVFRLLSKHKFSAHVTKIPNGAVLFIVGTVTGSLASMLGIGGGIILIPVLVWFGIAINQAAAISITCTLPMVITGATSAALVGYVIWPVAVFTGIGTVLGVPIGIRLSKILSESWVKRIFAVILVIISWQMWPKLW